jgi:hypothetical protein
MNLSIMRLFSAAKMSYESNTKFQKNGLKPQKGNLSASLGRRKLGKCSKVTSKWKMGFQRAAESFDVPYLCS